MTPKCSISSRRNKCPRIDDKCDEMVAFCVLLCRRAAEALC